MMLKTLIAAAVVLPLAATSVLAGSGGCNWSKKDDTVAQTQTPVVTPAPVVATQTPVPVPAATEAAKLDVAQAPAKPAGSTTN